MELHEADYLQRARDVLDTEISGIRKAQGNLGPEFIAAIRLLLACLRSGRKIVVTGVGKSLHIADKISATLASTGATSVVLHPSQAVHGDLGILTPGDVVIAISYSGESDELLTLIPSLKRNEAHIIALTGTPESRLAQFSDVILNAGVDKEACPFNMAPTASTTTALALGDALAMVLLEAQGFCKEDYARLHPAGAIGRALLLRASDIMRPADRVAAVPADARVRDALIAMTRARAGSCAILNEDRQVSGIFTDGDLRRNLSNRTAILDDPIKTLMTPNPITVTGDRLAVEVLDIFKAHNIDDVLVVDAEGRLISAIDIQDLPKFKIL
ncbi:MAG: hypothetical protein A2498_01000 [Lentisphaerae bacterium RIFOXYC12_FULL_60_16]|nr:MAG: hypothetical protein A2498_01000 [Lentisphaerae bacterium RIFOXYC12_FULL_60_16]OGV83813.1 MAG: hypothetical protein A2340_07380 [Lentisphaerae bacterium RIFOXYB12_FULL_60_10]